ncbi:acyl-CoA thioesterase [Flagellimonas lutimaris]|jgi:acyl-CoA thioester hydrolase|uniref:acyl-CoA thioesterase n=1 Tax=Flagellimonas TaxID=444459 RepID=UPI000B66DDDA|nr:MAG: acyl-CoA thioesterase [Muricauda sp. TMED12]|tara:strand:- start:338 stop:775 length:438 start_codon:yes stop_codon:yes gene_type:complete
MMDNNSNSYVTIELPVQWGDMDAAQHVNNTVYLRWIESARIQMFRKMQEGKLEFGKIIPILAWQDCKYIFPVTFPDQVIITVDVIELLEDRILCEGKIHSKKHERIVAISKTLLVAFDREESKKQQLPQKWTKSLTDFYGSSILK